jgi:hypothetical protein
MNNALNLARLKAATMILHRVPLDSDIEMIGGLLHAVAKAEAADTPLCVFIAAGSTDLPVCLWASHVSPHAGDEQRLAFIAAMTKAIVSIEAQMVRSTVQ